MKHHPFLAQFLSSFAPLVGMGVTVTPLILLIRIGVPLWFDALTCLLIVAVAVLVLALKKGSVSEMFTYKGSGYVNTAAGVRHESVDNGHSARPAASGVLSTDGSRALIFISWASFYALFSTLIKLATATIVVAGRNSPMVPREAYTYVSALGGLAWYVGLVIAHVLAVVLFMVAVRHNNDAHGARLITMVFAVLSAHYSGMSTGGSFYDPASERVRKVYRCADEQFDPMTARASVARRRLSTQL